MSPDVSLDEIREALSTRAEEVGWRETARQVGLSHNAVRGIVNGKNPYTKSLRALHAWYRAEKTRQPPLPKLARHTALVMLTRHLPDDRRQATIEELNRVLEAAET
jgi:hypothetical protein